MPPLELKYPVAKQADLLKRLNKIQRSGKYSVLTLSNGVLFAVADDVALMELTKCVNNWKRDQYSGPIKFTDVK